MEKYAAGTFGHVVSQLGLSWLTLSYVAHISPTTISRWAIACHEGRRVVLRCTEKQIEAIMSLLNDMDIARGGPGTYTRSDFGFDLPCFRLSDATTEVITTKISRINTQLADIQDPAQQYEHLVLLGTQARNDADRVAWDAAWRRYCRVEFPNTKNAYKTPPRKVSWYCPSTVLGGDKL